MVNTLAKSGLYGGNPDIIYNSRVDRVIDLYHYNNFIKEYETTFYELNKEKK